LIRSNAKLMTPRDFDHSPYFDVIKYPVLDFDELGIYQKLPWDQTSVHCNDIGDCFYSHPEEVENLIPIKSTKAIVREEPDKADTKADDKEKEEDIKTVKQDKISKKAL